jgi:YHS domain-containing protein
MKQLIVLLCVPLLFSCTEKVPMQASDNSVQVDISAVTNQTDPICHMPVKGHLADTALIGGQIWGFCSSACKEKYVQLK